MGGDCRLGARGIGGGGGGGGVANQRWKNDVTEFIHLARAEELQYSFPEMSLLWDLVSGALSYLGMYFY